MNTLIIILITVIILAYTSFVLLLLSPGDHLWFFKPAIRKYENKDRQSLTDMGSNLFTGSSIMKYWKTLENDMAPFPVLNRALSGSRITELAHFVDRIVIPYGPDKVFIYAGSNDIQGRKPRTPEQVLNGFRLFCDRVHNELPETKIFFISISPTPSRIRWKHWPAVQMANRLIKDFCEEDERLHFIDTTDKFLNDLGKPRSELFKIDGIHMNRKGYEIWTSMLRPLLD